LLSAKFSVQSDKHLQSYKLQNIGSFFGLIYDALTTKQARGELPTLFHYSMTSFFIVVDFTHEMAFLLPICGSFGRI